VNAQYEQVYSLCTNIIKDGYKLTKVRLCVGQHYTVLKLSSRLDRLDTLF